MPRFLHATAKLTRHLIDDVVDDPLETKSSVQIGSPELGHVPLDGQVRARARACAWAREHMMSRSQKPSMRAHCIPARLLPFHRAGRGGTQLQPPICLLSPSCSMPT